MRSGIVPSHIDGSRPVFIEQPLPHFGHFAAAFGAAKDDLRLAGVVVYSTQALVLGWLTGGREHDLLAFRTPHRLQGWEPTDIEFIRIVKGIARLYLVAGVLDRLFLTS